MNVAPKAQKSKAIYKWTLSKCFCTAKKTIIIMERQLVLGKILANHGCDKELMSKHVRISNILVEENIKEVDLKNGKRT